MIHSGNRFLSKSEMTDNANYILNYLTARGWTKNAVCGMLGNMETESTINPAIWQNLDEWNTNLGFGLVQWTKATKYLDWCSANGLVYDQMDSNLKRILWEVDNNEQWGYDSNDNPPPFNFKAFTESTLPPYTLAMYFLIYYERPGDQNQPFRGQQALEWYNLLTGETGGGNTGYIPTRKSNIYKYLTPLWKRRII